MNKYAVRKALKLAFQELTVSRRFVASQAMIDHKIESIIYKLASEFDDAVKDKKFKNPETGNMVKFKSLPEKEQEKLRSSFKPKTNVKKLEEGMKEFLGNASARAKQIGNSVREMSKPDFKNKIKDGLKTFVNADDFSAFSDAVKKKDKGAMKKALPGMAKGVAKVVGTIAAVALGVGAVKFAPMISSAITTKFMAGKAAVAGFASNEMASIKSSLAQYANPETAKQLADAKTELAQRAMNKDLDVLMSVSEESPATYDMMSYISETPKVIAENTAKITELNKSLNTMPLKEVASKASKVFFENTSKDLHDFVTKAGESIASHTPAAAKELAKRVHEDLQISVKYLGDKSEAVSKAWSSLGEEAVKTTEAATTKASAMVQDSQASITGMYKSLETNLADLAKKAKALGEEEYKAVKDGANSVVKKLTEEAATVKKMTTDAADKIYNNVVATGKSIKDTADQDWTAVKTKVTGYADKVQSAYNERYGEHFAYSAADTKKISGLQEYLKDAQEAMKDASMKGLSVDKLQSATDKVLKAQSELDAAHTAAKAAGHAVKVNSLMTDVYKGTVLAGLVKNVGSAAVNKVKEKTNKKAAEDKEMDEFSEELRKFVIEEMNKLKDSGYLEKLLKG